LPASLGKRKGRLKAPFADLFCKIITLLLLH
jgi:hypothetical protein